MVFLLATILKCRSGECTSDVLDYIVTPFPPASPAPAALQFDLYALILFYSCTLQVLWCTQLKPLWLEYNTLF